MAERATLFSKLAKYSLHERRLSTENFTTEVLAHLFNRDAAFRRRFLREIIPDGRIARAFMAGEARTQVPYPSCIADIVLFGAASRRHLVEVKIRASEAMTEAEGRVHSQIDRYLDLKMGHVTYLTTRHTPPHSAELRGRRLRVHHALFETLYTRLRAAPLSEIGREFVVFMEEQGMSPARPFDRRDMRRAREAFDLMHRSREMMLLLRQELTNDFAAPLRGRGALRAPDFLSGPDWATFDCSSHGFRKRGAIRTIGFSLSTEDAEPGIYFTVYIWGTRTKELRWFGEKVLGWKEFSDGSGFGTWFKLRGGPNDYLKMKQFALKESRRLAAAIKRHY